MKLNQLKAIKILMLACILMSSRLTVKAQGDKNTGYLERFKEMRDEIYDPANGYFSPDGAPYHSIETLIVEAPDHGHESTSELYSYWVWLEAMHGKLTGDWKPLNDVWKTMEEQIIPSAEDQPNTIDYDPSDPADYAPEFGLPSNYPAPLDANIPVGEDPVSPDLTSTYGTTDVYGMHWLLDCDNFYGYGNRGDGVSTPSYINTFQRGAQESTWETIPHPSWDDFSNGGDSGFLPLFTADDAGHAKQWRYTNAPDADARVVQAMYWAYLWANEQGLDAKATIPVDKAVKMGDYLRLAMFDKYFKPLGTQSPNAQGGQGYESAHYLMSWYYSWGGKVPVEGEDYGWSWRIGASANHFGYQNPVAAWVLSNVPDFKPSSANGARDWSTSFDRQMDFYEYLQSPEGPIAGGATNSWNGDYSAHPAGKSTFYGMAYDEDPVYEDPGSNTWPGFQGWSMERISELYYLNNDARAKGLLEKWVPWLISEVQLIGDNDFMVPASFEWTGEPDTWTGSKSTNSNLSVSVVEHGRDVGVAASFARALIYYAAATEKYGTLDVASRDLAKEILDRMWVTYRDDKGISAPETRADYTRFFEQEVYVPTGFSGTMANGDEIKPGVNFLDIRSHYKNDPAYAGLKASYDAGEDYVTSYHRGWAQMEIALANAEFGLFFGDEDTDLQPSVTITSPADGATFADAPSDIVITADAQDDGAVQSVSFYQNGTLISTDASAPYAATFANAAAGTYTITVEATDDTGNVGSSEITVEVGVTEVCDLATVFGVPRATGVPTINNTIYDNVFLLGDAPAISNISTFTINWANESWGSGLWHMGIQTTDGNPTWYLNITSTSNSLASSSPEITFSGTGISGLDGAYYANVVGSDLVLVAKSGAYAIYFSESSTAPEECISIGTRLANGTVDNGASLFDAVKVYPNPATNHFTLSTSDLEGTEKIVLLNSLGLQIDNFSERDFVNGALNFGSDLKSGIYLLSIQKGGEIKTYSLIKK